MPAAARCFLAALLAPCALALIARADVLVLANGDHLQGRLVARQAGQIVWESPVLGLVTAPEAQATVIPDSTALPPQGSATVTTTTTHRPTAADTAAAKANRKTTIESGIALQSGRSDRADFDLRVETTYQQRRNSLRALARYRYSKADGSVTTDRTEAGFRWRRELDPRWFGQTNTSYLSAKAKGIDHNLEQNVGLGHRFLKTDRANASLGAGLTGQYREIGDAETGQSLFGEVFQDFTLKLSPRLDFGEDFSAQYSPSGRGIRNLPGGQVQLIDTSVANYKLTLNAFLRGKLSDTLSLSLRYEYEFDNTFVSRGAKTEQRITTTLGCTF